MDNVLKRAAAELKEAGCRVFAWQDDTYNRSWSKGDYIMLYYAFPDSPNIGYLSHGEYGMSVAYSRAYIPSRGSGSGCHIKEEATFDLETSLDVLNGPLPSWCKAYGVYPKQYKDISRGYAQIRRAEHYGHSICFTRLSGNKFYFEKIKEGRTQQYINRRK